ncbi:MAG: YkgJ family cysteine cluster protein [Desulfobacter sp.]|nr:MAG: YkgJ family cysteine cluster protein [Desulfobacter sp.]
MDDTSIIDELFKNYNALIARIDAHTAAIQANWDGQIACKKGCDDCCRFLSLFPVEAFALSRAFCALAPPDREKVVDQARAGEEKCPLLVDHACMVYQARPVICRTHGLPIYMEKGGKVQVDFCPENFKGLTELPKEALLDIDQLNTLLAAVNGHFLENLDADLPDRIPVSEALELWQALETD